MKQSLAAALLVLFFIGQLSALEKQYQSGKILATEQKARTRVLYYLVNTPVTKDDPYYEVSVKVKDTIYVGEYTPRHAADSLPYDWDVGAEIQVLVSKHHMLVRRPGGTGLDLLIVKQTEAPPEQKVSPPPGGKN